MGLLNRIFGRTEPRNAMQPLYGAIIAAARQPRWYAQGGVADTIDGRFNMVAAVLCLVLLRLEGDDSARQPSAWLAELFIADMDGQMRQIGLGDVIVGKEIGRMMGALGGRMGAYRDAFASADAGDMTGLTEAVQRNILEGDALDTAYLVTNLLALRGELASRSTGALLAGDLPGV